MQIELNAFLKSSPEICESILVGSSKHGILI